MENLVGFDIEELKQVENKSNSKLLPLPERKKAWAESFYNAIEEGDIDTLKELFDTPKNVQLQVSKIINEEFMDKILQNFNEEILDLLINKGLEINHCFNTFLHKAIKMDNENAFNYFLKKEKTLNNRFNSNFRTDKDYYKKVIQEYSLNNLPKPKETANKTQVELDFSYDIKHLYSSLLYSSKKTDSSISLKESIKTKYRKKIEKEYPLVFYFSINENLLLNFIDAQPLKKEAKNASDDLIKELEKLSWEDFFVNLVENRLKAHLFTKDFILKLENFLHSYPKIKSHFMDAQKTLQEKNAKINNYYDTYMPKNENILNSDAMKSFEKYITQTTATSIFGSTTYFLNGWLNNLKALTNHKQNEISKLGLPINAVIRYTNKPNAYNNNYHKDLKETLEKYNLNYPAFIPKNFTDAIIYNGSPVLKEMAKTKSGIKAIEKSLENEYVMHGFCQNTNFDTICLILKNSEKLRNYIDDFGNTVAHYAVVYNHQNTKTAALRLLNIDKELFTKENNIGLNCLEIMKSFGLNGDSFSQVSHKLIRKTLHSNSDTSKKMRSHNKKKRAM